MITAASIIFLLAFVALGARPYRVSERVPQCEEVPAMPATIYARQMPPCPLCDKTVGVLYPDGRYLCDICKTLILP